MIEPLNLVKKLREGHDFESVGYTWFRAGDHRMTNPAPEQHQIELLRVVGGIRETRVFTFTPSRERFNALPFRGGDRLRRRSAG